MSGEERTQRWLERNIANGAYQDERQRRVPIIFLAGPIKHWWTCWGSPEHLDYVDHRDFVRHTLIRAGYLTYASWDAVKGTWDQRAQAINDAAIACSDLLIVMTPEGIPADGTEDEDEYARRLGKTVIYFNPHDAITQYNEHGRTRLLRYVEAQVGKGIPYD